MENTHIENEKETKNQKFEMELDCFDPSEQEDKLWKARTGLDEDTLCGAVETIIFMSEKPIALEKIKNLVDKDMPLRVIHFAILRLQKEYEQNHHGLRLQEVAEGYQFRTKATFSKYVQDLYKVGSLSLSPTALEVLAIIAYKQPISNSGVEKVRGVDSSHIVRALMDKRLIKVVGRSDEMGKPSVYGTSPEFLEVFNLKDLSDLPSEHELEEMAQEGIGKISDIQSIVHEGDKERFYFDETEELDKLSESIKSIASETGFTKSLKLEEKRRTDEKGEETRSAFDLLEDYLAKNQSSEANKTSSESELFTPVTDPQVIKDISVGPFNLPESEEDFEMIDLETGKPLEELDKQNSEEIYNEEESSLSEALDKAFDNLSVGNIDDELVLDDSKVSESEKKLDEREKELTRQAKDLDINIDFMNPEDNPES